MENKIKPTDQEIQETAKETSEFIREIQMNAIKKFPLWMRMNYFAIKITQALNEGHKEDEFDWGFINTTITKDLDPFDCNLYEPVSTVEEFEIQRVNIIAASEGIGPWQKHKCKDCGEEFYMNFKEVQFYKDKELNLPKRCKECRAKRKKGD